MSPDIKNYFLQSLLKDLEYLRIHSKWFLADIHKKYNIASLITPDGYVYCKIKQVVYGLEQAPHLARDQLIVNLKPHHEFVFDLDRQYHRSFLDLNYMQWLNFKSMTSPEAGSSYA